MAKTEKKTKPTETSQPLNEQQIRQIVRRELEDAFGAMAREAEGYFGGGVVANAARAAARSVK